jgi:hypothetical protein
MASSFTFDKVTINPKVFERKIFEAAAKSMALDINARLTEEVGSGRNADGGSLKGYSAAYRKAIIKGYVRRGRSGQRKNSTSTNLRISGRLLSSKKVRRVKGGAEIYFSGQHYSGQSNAQLAQRLHDMGFVGWHELGLKDELIIEEGTGDIAQRAAEQMVKVQKGK